MIRPSQDWDGYLETAAAKQQLAYVAEDFEAELMKDPRAVEGVHSFGGGRDLVAQSQRFRCAEVLFRPDAVEFTVADSLFSCLPEGAEGGVETEEARKAARGKRSWSPFSAFHSAFLGGERGGEKRSAEGGLHTAVFAAIKSCAPELQPLLFQNIVLSGGGSLVRGLKERLTLELQKLVLAEHGAHGGGPEVAVCAMHGAARKHDAWMGGSMAGSMEFFQKKKWVTRAEFERDPEVLERVCTGYVGQL